MITISIITINFNNAIGLRKTLDSVFLQNFTNYEHVIVDGGSSDGSKEIIQFYNKKFSYWVSEKDTGIYNAMNKGITKAKGDYLLFLNSGDYLLSKDSLATLLSNNNNEEIIYGNLFLTDGKNEWLKTYPSKLTFDFFTKDSLPHQATLIKKTLFDKVGNYSEHLKIVADWEFFLNAICLYSCSYRYVSFPISVYNIDGISSDPINKLIIADENDKIFQTKYTAFIDDYKKLNELEKELSMYKYSRLHQFVQKILTHKIYRSIKRVRNIF